KQKPNFEPTGLLAKEANTVSTSRAGRSVVLKYHEPAEARKPPSTQAWRLYKFSGGATEPVETVYLYERSCWLFGRETSVVDVLLDEPTASKQHAVVQFRYSAGRNEYGDKIERVRPYVIDLESKSGTSLNGSKMEAGRYVELRDGDVLVFGAPERD
ncbi:SMAD/FHA domain-containing protein, partial [Myriangium duriaei CBS 260.36]